MQAFRVVSFDRPPRIADIPVPTPSDGEVLVKVRAAGLNFADTLMCDGRYQETPPPPFTLGLELAGEVVDGAGTHLRRGDRVAVYSGQGGLAEFGAFPAARCIRLPAAMSFAQAAGFQIAYGTSHVALDHLARLRPGETLAVLGAGGGVGLTAIEIGRLMGARVVAAARGTGKLAAAEAAGAHHLIDTDTEDLRDALRSLGRADVVYDPVGGDQFTAAFRATNPGGRILVIGFASGKVPGIPANHLMVKNISLLGLNWGGYLSFAPQVLTDSLTILMDWFSEGRLQPHVGEVLPLARAAEGLDRLRQRRARGKIVIEIPGQ